MPGPEPREKTPLDKLVAKKNGILGRIKDPSVSPEEKKRAQARLQKTQQAIEQLQARTRGLALLKVDAF